MAETQLITITDLPRRIDPKFNLERFNAFVDSVQRKNLRDLLGDAMYYAFMEDDRTSGKYMTLVDGETYTYNGQTVNFYGLKPLLGFWVLAVLARESDLYVSGYGAISFVDNQQQKFQSAKEKERIAAGYMEEAARYENDTKQYLTEKSSTYTLWEYEPQRNESEFISFKL